MNHALRIILDFIGEWSPLNYEEVIEELGPQARDGLKKLEEGNFIKRRGPYLVITQKGRYYRKILDLSLIHI